MKPILLALGVCLLALPAQAARHPEQGKLCRAYLHGVAAMRGNGALLYRCWPRRAQQARDARPRAWCGWWMRRQVGRDPGVLFNLARAWAHWGQPASPGIGVIVVWPRGGIHGHVGMITGRTADGRWIVKSGNDGGKVRERPRSLAGAIAFRRG